MWSICINPIGRSIMTAERWTLISFSWMNPRVFDESVTAILPKSELFVLNGVSFNLILLRRVGPPRHVSLCVSPVLPDPSLARSCPPVSDCHPPPLQLNPLPSLLCLIVLVKQSNIVGPRVNDPPRLWRSLLKFSTVNAFWFGPLSHNIGLPGNILWLYKALWASGRVLPIINMCHQPCQFSILNLTCGLLWCPRGGKCVQKMSFIMLASTSFQGSYEVM